MDNIDFFDNMDLKEVSKRTLIDLKELSYLKNDEFDKLSKTKGLGFIKIIEREYKVDLSDKKEKFLEYLKENNKDINNEFFIAPPKTSSKVFPKVFALSLVFLIVAGALYILYLNSLSNPTTAELKPEKNQIIQEAKKISGIDINDTDDNAIDNPMANDIKNEENKTVKIIEENITTIESKEVVSQNLSDVPEEENISVKFDKNEKPMQLLPKKQADVAMPIQNSINNQEVNGTNYQLLTIVPKKRIWVGVIDLSNYKKSSYIKDSNITISKNSSFLIATGHGKFDIYYKEQVIKFDTINPVKLLVKDGKVVKIDKKEFIKLNRGKYW